MDTLSTGINMSIAGIRSKRGDSYCRVTPTHVQALIKRYREVLGECEHYARAPGRLDRHQQSVSAVIALRDALRICSPDCDLGSILPPRYRPPESLPHAQLQRDILRLLGQHPSGIDIRTISQQLVDQYDLVLDSKSRSRLERRIQRYRTRTSACIARSHVISQYRC